MLGKLSKESSYFAIHTPCKTSKRTSLPFLNEPNLLFLASHMLSLPDTAAHNGRVSEKKAVLPIKKAVGQTRSDLMLIVKLQACLLTVTMLMATPREHVI